MLSRMTSLQREFSSAPVPDWQRQRERPLSASIALHQPFEAPYRSLIRADSCVQPAARLWAKLAVKIVELNRVRFRSRRLADRVDAGHPSPVALSTPSWVSDTADLPAFSSLSVEKWIAAINGMIREQLPYFQLHPDWRNVAEDTAPDSQTQTQILNQIDREVRRLAECADSLRPNHRDEIEA